MCKGGCGGKVQRYDFGAKRQNKEVAMEIYEFELGDGFTYRTKRPRKT